MYERGESELTTAKLQLPRKAASEQVPSRPAKKVCTSTVIFHKLTTLTGGFTMLEL